MVWTLTVGGVAALILLGVLLGAGAMLAIVVSLGRPDPED